MPLIKCPDCESEVSDQAPACPRCGRPIAVQNAAPPQRMGDTQCPSCHQYVTPVVTSVGGGSCSFGSRDTWRCPACKHVILKKGCFIATATYGDEDIVEVRFLRAFRDRYLLPSRIGRVITNLYYRHGPFLADIVEAIPTLTYICRRVLDAIVTFIERITPLRREHFRHRE